MNNSTACRRSSLGLFPGQPAPRPRQLAEGEQALVGLLCVYDHVLERAVDRMGGVVRARKPKRLPAVLHQPLQDHLWHVGEQHQADLKRGLCRPQTAG